MSDQEELREVKDKEELVALRDKMKQHLPLSITVFNTLRMITVDVLKDAIVLAPKEDSSSTMCLIIQDAKEFKVVALFCPPEGAQDLKRILLSSHLIPWEPSIVFIFLLDSLMDSVMEACETRGMVRRHEKAPLKLCPVFFPPEEGFKGNWSLPPDYHMESIRKEDLQTVLDNWSFNSFFDAELLKKRAKSYESAALYYKENEIAAWVLEDDLGAVGKLFTMPNHRRKGLGKVLLAKFANILLSHNKIPYSIVDVDNIPSKRLFEGLQYRQHFMVGFIHAWPNVPK